MCIRDSYMSTLASRQKKIESLMSKHQHFESILNQVNKSLSVDDLVITDATRDDEDGSVTDGTSEDDVDGNLLLLIKLETDFE